MPPAGSVLTTVPGRARRVFHAIVRNIPGRAAEIGRSDFEFSACPSRARGDGDEQRNCSSGRGGWHRLAGVLTLGFETASGRYIVHAPWSRIASDYDLPRGLPIGLVVLSMAPLIAARVRHVR